MEQPSLDMEKPFATQDLVAEVKRELNMRRSVYARRIEQGKMSTSDADWQIGLMQEVLKCIEWAIENGYRRNS